MCHPVNALVTQFEDRSQCELDVCQKKCSDESTCKMWQHNPNTNDCDVLTECAEEVHKKNPLKVKFTLYIKMSGNNCFSFIKN